MTASLLQNSKSTQPRRSLSAARLRQPERASTGKSWWHRSLALCLLGLVVAWFGLACPPVRAQDDAQKKAVASETSPSDQNAAGKQAAESKPEAAKKAPAMSREAVLVSSLTIFVLAIFVGFEVITKVPPTLHTPLMSGSNAISGITIVGAIIITGQAAGFSASTLGFLAVIFATINVVGGFLVTHRMLSMFKKR